MKGADDGPSRSRHTARAWIETLSSVRSLSKYPVARVTRRGRGLKPVAQRLGRSDWRRSRHTARAWIETECNAFVSAAAESRSRHTARAWIETRVCPTARLTSRCRSRHTARAWIETSRHRPVEFSRKVARVTRRGRGFKRAKRARRASCLSSLASHGAGVD